MRPNVQTMENLLGKKIDLLDHGFIRVIDYMGCDESIVQAARVSYGNGTKTISEDTSLINYLLRHKHTTPFEMCEIKIHIKMPIFVARQWIRHRAASLNELSARYSIVPDEYYIPDINDLCEQSKNNKQGREKAIEESIAIKIKKKMEKSCSESFDVYKTFLNDNNLARELARTVLPVSMYTEIYWKIDLHNLLHFLHLRASDHAQKEIRVYAIEILKIVEKWVPITYNAFMNYVKNSISLSGDDLLKLKNLINIKKAINLLNNINEKKGEDREFIEKIRKIIS